MLARGAEAAGEEGLLCERWQIEAGLARVAAATNRLEEAEDRSRRARELIDTMAASVDDEEIGTRFRERALAEIDRRDDAGPLGVGHRPRRVVRQPPIDLEAELLRIFQRGSEGHLQRRHLTAVGAHRLELAGVVLRRQPVHRGHHPLDRYAGGLQLGRPSRVCGIRPRGGPVEHPLGPSEHGCVRQVGVQRHVAPSACSASAAARTAVWSRWWSPRPAGAYMRAPARSTPRSASTISPGAWSASRYWPSRNGRLTAARPASASARRSSSMRVRTVAAESLAPPSRSHHPSVPAGGSPAKTFTTSTSPAPASRCQHESTASSKWGERMTAWGPIAAHYRARACNHRETGAKARARRGWGGCHGCAPTLVESHGARRG